MPAHVQGLTRSELQSVDFPPGYATRSFPVTVPPQGVVARHTHPGVEMGYLVLGSGTISVQGQAHRTVKPGDSWVFPAGVAHALRNSGNVPEQLLVTYVLEKGKPLATSTPLSLAGLLSPLGLRRSWLFQPLFIRRTTLDWLMPR